MLSSPSFLVFLSPRFSPPFFPPVGSFFRWKAGWIHDLRKEEEEDGRRLFSVSLSSPTLFYFHPVAILFFSTKGTYIHDTEFADTKITF